MAQGRLSLYRPWCEPFRTQGYSVKMRCDERVFVHTILPKQDYHREDAASITDAQHVMGFKKVIITINKVTEPFIGPESVTYFGEAVFKFSNFAPRTVINPIHFVDNGRVVLTLDWTLEFTAGVCNMFPFIPCLHKKKKGQSS